MTTTKQRVLEAFSYSESSHVKRVLEILYPEAFVKEETTPLPDMGKWYKNKSNKALIFYEKEKSFYGFLGNKEWFDSNNIFIINCINMFSGEWKEADPETIKQYLIEEAGKRGFKPDINFKCLRTGLYNSIVLKINTCDFYYNGTNVLWYYGYAIYSNGKWAEIVSAHLEVTLEEVAKKFGVESVIIK